mmetsp:Transcript_172165/g.551842  ORF Transcript_172165/g.551842 Transcript_172165/m.551842 type:complete len:433 (+) Transcript_172165:557-1855(+)
MHGLLEIRRDGRALVARQLAACRGDVAVQAPEAARGRQQGRPGSAFGRHLCELQLQRRDLVLASPRGGFREDSLGKPQRLGQRVIHLLRFLLYLLLPLPRLVLLLRAAVIGFGLAQSPHDVAHLSTERAPTPPRHVRRCAGDGGGMQQLRRGRAELPPASCGPCEPRSAIREAAHGAPMSLAHLCTPQCSVLINGCRLDLKLHHPASLLAVGEHPLEATPLCPQVLPHPGERRRLLLDSSHLHGADSRGHEAGGTRGSQLLLQVPPPLLLNGSLGLHLQDCLVERKLGLECGMLCFLDVPPDTIALEGPTSLLPSDAALALALPSLAQATQGDKAESETGDFCVVVCGHLRLGRHRLGCNKLLLPRESAAGDGGRSTGGLRRRPRRPRRRLRHGRRRSASAHRRIGARPAREGGLFGLHCPRRQGARRLPKA